MQRGVIFDMDGLLIDSEPYWEEAGKELLENYDVSLTNEQYKSSTGLRTREWLEHWFNFFKLPKDDLEKAEEIIVDKAVEKITAHAQPMPGVDFILNFFKDRNYKTGLATSSPLRLVDAVLKKLTIENSFSSISSAEKLPFGKPHPQVYLNCAEELNVSPMQCIAFEDSFNGMIAAKAAKMKCVIVPLVHHHHETRWDAADIKLSSLLEFNDEVLKLVF